MNPVKWENLPADCVAYRWYGDGAKVQDVDCAFNLEKKASIFRLELSEQERRQLIEGNPVYLSLIGHVIPFMVSVNLAEITESIRSL